MVDKINDAELNEVSGGMSGPSDGKYYNYVSNGWVPYTIQRGDTLSVLAQTYGTTVEMIMVINPKITNKNEIIAGYKLLLPATKA